MSEHTDAMRALHRLDDDQITCRRGSGIGHAWRVLGYWQAAGGETRRTLRCDRCETEAVDRWFKRTGERSPRQYRYADGYLLTEHPQAFEVRMEIMRRVDVYANEAEMREALSGARQALSANGRKRAR